MSRDIPIIFSGPMVRALLDGRKTQTRRLLKLPTKGEYVRPDLGGWEQTTVGGGGSFRVARDGTRVAVPEMAAIWNRTTGTTIVLKYQVGDRLWVRENLVPTTAGIDYEEGGDECLDLVAATAEQTAFWDRYALKRGDPMNAPTVPCIHMPRWASRLTLVVTAVKVERLQHITLTDIEREGITPAGQNMEAGAALKAWIDLWETLHGKGSWDANPELVALTFSVAKANIDTVPRQEAA